MKKRLLGIALLVAGVPLVAACGGPACAQGDERGEEAVYTLELRDGPPGDMTHPLTLSHDTLVFPLALDEETQLLTSSAPGDLVIAYTRVGCWIDDPETWIGDSPLRAVPPVHLTQITIDEVSEVNLVDYEPGGPSENHTCFTYRTCDGVWHPLVAPTTISAAGGVRTTTLSLDVEGVDAAAIFLPGYTHVSRITYTAE